MDVAGNRKAIVVHVPYRITKPFCKIHVRLVRELEKKFSGKQFFTTVHSVGCHLYCYSKDGKATKERFCSQRPRSRTLTAVHDAVLEDLVYPAQIVGKHVRYKLDGSEIVRIFLDPKRTQQH